MIKRALRKTKRVAAGAYKRVKTNPGVSPASKQFIHNLDSPARQRQQDKTVMVEGWVIPLSGRKITKLRLKANGVEVPIKHGLKRPDVTRAYPDYPDDISLHSGFRASFDLAGETELTIEAITDRGTSMLHKVKVFYSPESLASDYYNPNLAQNQAEHLNLIANKQQYFYEEPVAGEYVRHKDDPRLMAFYLPQFHPIPENDKVWGKGFTEWTNVTADTPRFVGQVQPILPKDTGFYDLRLEQNIADQIAHAKKHGIYGFCFYYYWFSGKRLLEKPLDSFLKHKEWDFSFTICWANENWTKKWDGRDNEVIVAQEYRQDDPLKFIKDVEPILLDPRYIREDGKPVLVVFRASELKEPAEYARVWRKYFRDTHGLELHLVSCMSFETTDPREYGFDAALDFAPQSAFFKNDCFPGGRYPYVDVSDKLIDPNFEGSVADYRTIALNQKANAYFPFPTHKCVTPSWDNDARKKGKGFVMHYENPDVYGRWLHNVLDNETKSLASPLVFLNAWNEWAEGAVLEPTAHYGSAVLNRTTEVLSEFSANGRNKTDFPLHQISRTEGTKLAVVIHMYYPEKWEYLRGRLTRLGSLGYDLFITLNAKDKDFAATVKKSHANARIYVVPNRGRDVLPFVHLGRRLRAAGYEYVLKLHTKKSTHRADGDQWFEQVVTNLLPSEAVTRQIIDVLAGGKTAMVGPKGHLVSLRRHMGSNQPMLQRTLATIYGEDKAQKIIDEQNNYPYFGGTMFWASLESLAPLFDMYLMPEDFQSESGQIDGTMAHALERALGVLPQIDGRPLYQASAEEINEAKLNDPEQKYEYAP